MAVSDQHKTRAVTRRVSLEAYLGLIETKAISVCMCVCFRFTCPR